MNSEARRLLELYREVTDIRKIVRSDLTTCEAKDRPVLEAQYGQLLDRGDELIEQYSQARKADVG